jgi:ATP-dependent DNA ligase
MGKVSHYITPLFWVKRLLITQMSARQLLEGDVMLCEDGEERDLKNPKRKFESKFDGTRIKAVNIAYGTDIRNRRGFYYRNKLPEVNAELKLLPFNTVLDGEIVVHHEGNVVFERSTSRCGGKDMAPTPEEMRENPVKFMVWDLLMLKGDDLRMRRWIERKAILKELIEPLNLTTIQYVPFHDDGTTLYASEKEGVVAKLIDSPYQMGVRSFSWLKIKHTTDAVLDIVGFTAGAGKRNGWFGALVLAQDGKFKGTSGPGHMKDRQSAAFSRYVLATAKRVPQPFGETLVGETYTAIETGWKAEVTYGEMTKFDKMRFPRIKRLIPPPDLANKMLEQLIID